MIPNPKALLCLAGVVSVEQYDAWAAADRRHFSEQAVTLVTTTTLQAEEHVEQPQLMTTRSQH